MKQVSQIAVIRSTCHYRLRVNLSVWFKECACDLKSSTVLNIKTEYLLYKDAMRQWYLKPGPHYS